MSTIGYCVNKALKITGGAGTGKTELLIARVVELLEKGESPHDICCVCASPWSAATFRKRLTAATQLATEAITVTTPREESLFVLSSERARVVLGRAPHVLTNFEYNFLIEDMKVSGLQPRRLKEMLKFLYKGLTELSDEDENWLIIPEERLLFDYLQRKTSFMGGILEFSLSNTAFKLLRGGQVEVSTFKFKHVLVDDYQCLNRASQHLAHALALNSLSIAGDPNACVEVNDPYPYGKGLEEFDILHPDAERIVLTSSFLPKAIAALENALGNDACMESEWLPKTIVSDKEGFVETHEYMDAEAEFKGTAELIKERLADQSDVLPSDIFILAPNKTWMKNICKALKSADVANSSQYDHQILGGDIRDNERSSALRVYTALNLIANPKDCVAWRCWCGFGDYLTNSMFFNELEAFASENDMSMIEALEFGSQNDGEGFNGPEKALQAYRAGISLIQEAESLSGQHLVTALPRLVTGNPSAKLPCELEELLGVVGDNETAAELYARAERNLTNTKFPDDETCVRVGMSKGLCGSTPEILILTGFVNGFFPDRDYFDGAKTSIDKQIKMHSRDTHHLYYILGKAQREVHFSYFTQADLQSAELLRLKIERIRLNRKGERICYISPSQFLPVVLP